MQQVENLLHYFSKLGPNFCFRFHNFWPIKQIMLLYIRLVCSMDVFICVFVSDNFLVDLLLDFAIWHIHQLCFILQGNNVRLWGQSWWELSWSLESPLVLSVIYFSTENLTLKPTNIPIQWDNCSFNMYIIITPLVVELGKPSIFRVEML